MSLLKRRLAMWRVLWQVDLRCALASPSHAVKASCPRVWRMVEIESSWCASGHHDVPEDNWLGSGPTTPTSSATGTRRPRHTRWETQRIDGPAVATWGWHTSWEYGNWPCGNLHVATRRRASQAGEMLHMVRSTRCGKQTWLTRANSCPRERPTSCRRHTEGPSCGNPRAASWMRGVRRLGGNTDRQVHVCMEVDRDGRQSHDRAVARVLKDNSAQTTPSKSE